jgi:hypothetical protein
VSDSIAAAPESARVAKQRWDSVVKPRHKKSDAGIAWKEIHQRRELDVIGELM